MIGARAGDRVLVVGADDAGLAADTALVTGLNGRTLVVDSAPGMQARIDAAAARAGALVETEASPIATLDAASFDIVIVQSGLAAQADQGVTLLSEAARVARPGGRVLVIERTGRTGWLGAIARPPAPPMAGSAVCDALTRAGLRAARVLAERDGAMYIEASRGR